MQTILEIASVCNVRFLSKNLLLSEDWRLEMMKTLDRPERFSQNFKNFFQANIEKKKMRCFKRLVLQQFHKSLMVVKYHVASKRFVTVELKNVTSQDYVININDMRKC